jgi:prepilin-type N-terminal cleavage/methylation domain-containing protein
MMFKNSQKAFTLTEMLVVLAVSSILIIAITMFVGRSFQLRREHFEQAQITEDARLQIDRIMKTIKNGRYVDCDGDGVVENYGPPPERWLLGANKYAITLRTNVDADSDPEMVSYYLTNDSQLIRKVTQLGSTGCDVGEVSETTVLTGVRNRDDQKAIFEYYKAGGAKPIKIEHGLNDLTSHQLAEVELVGINLVVDANIKQKPDAVLVATRAQPRAITDNMCKSETTMAKINVEKTGNYVLSAFGQCQSFCGGLLDSVNPGSCCGWNSFIVGSSDDGTQLETICSCLNSAVLEGGVIVDDDNFTAFAESCLITGGNPVCDAGCLSGTGSTGECVCEY